MNDFSTEEPTAPLLMLAVDEGAELERLLGHIAVDVTPALKGISRAQLRSHNGRSLVDDLMREWLRGVSDAVVRAT